MDLFYKKTAYSGMKGNFMIIALEGLDNSGKTTQTELLYSALVAEGYNVVVSKELTTDVGKMLKLSFNSNPYSPIMKTLLFAADRQKRIEDFKLSGSLTNSIIIFDRYKHSAIAYRKSEGISRDWVMEVNKYVLPYDLGIYIDISPEESIRRNSDKKSNIHYTIEQLDIIRKEYLYFVALGELHKIDGTMTQSDITEQILMFIKELKYGE